MFLTIHEALEFCESALIHQFSLTKEPKTILLAGPQELTLSQAFSRILDAEEDDQRV